MMMVMSPPAPALISSTMVPVVGIHTACGAQRQQRHEECFLHKPGHGELLSHTDPAKENTATVPWFRRTQLSACRQGHKEAGPTYDNAGTIPGAATCKHARRSRTMETYASP